ncbi:hypothetical protein GCM10027614_27870 [Micromonospora vulcania]
MLRDVLALGAAMIAVGASFGAVAVGAGLPVWAVLTMSAVLYAGGAQFMAVGLVAAGSPLAAVLAGLLLNARHLPFGLALGDSLGPRLRHRLLGSHLMTDEVTAFALARPAGPPGDGRSGWPARCSSCSGTRAPCSACSPVARSATRPHWAWTPPSRPG